MERSLERHLERALKQIRAGNVPMVDVQAGEELVKITRFPDELWFSRGRGRFDVEAPEGTCYLARDLDMAVSEFLANCRTLTMADIEAHKVVRLRAAEPFSVADLSQSIPRSVVHAAFREQTTNLAKAALDMYGGAIIGTSGYTAGKATGLQFVSAQSNETTLGVALFASDSAATDTNSDRGFAMGYDSTPLDCVAVDPLGAEPAFWERVTSEFTRFVVPIDRPFATTMTNLPSRRR